MKKRNFILITIFGVVLFISDLPKRFGPVNYFESSDPDKENKEFVRESTSYMEQLKEPNWVGRIWLMLKKQFNGGNDYIEFELENCQCKRRIYIKGIDEKNKSSGKNGGQNMEAKIKYKDTTCSLPAFKRGFGQKVVAFSIYGDLSSNKSQTKGYFEGIVENLRLMPIYYPGWNMRLYHDIREDDPVIKDLCSLACSSSVYDLCNVRELPGTPTVDATKIFPMNWRFFPTMDPQVDVFSSRDLDSRLNARELSAVKEWIENSTQPIHVMRDHPQHTIGMLGAAWDADLNRKNSREYWKEAWEKMMKDPLIYAAREKHGSDQFLLQRHVWRRFGRGMSLQHDAYLCASNPRSIGWPTKRLMQPNNFVASVVKENVTLIKKCPMKCRRYSDWEYC